MELITPLNSSHYLDSLINTYYVRLQMNKTQLQKQLKRETKYSRWYLTIIENARNSNRSKLKKMNESYIYYENHHILPRSIFKEYSNLKEYKWNAVLLTAKEHFICHRLIQKHYSKIGYI